MHRPGRITTPIKLAIVLLSLNQAPLSGANYPTEREVNSKLANLDKVFSHLQGSYTCEGKYEEIGPAGQVTTARVVFKRNGNLLCLEKHFIHGEKETGHAWVICRGPDRSFFLERDNEESPFVVRAVTSKRDGDHERSSSFILLNEFEKNYRTAPFGVKGDLPEIAGSSKLNIESVELEAVVDPATEKKNLVKATYRFDGGGEVISHWGLLMIDPDKSWTVVKQNIEQSIPNAAVNVNYVNAEYAYREVGGLLFPSLVSIEFFEDKSRLGSTSFNADHIESLTVPDEAFAMTAYGIPEVAIGPPTRPGLFSLQGWPFWALFAVAVAAFLIARMLNRRWNA